MIYAILIRNWEILANPSYKFSRICNKGDFFPSSFEFTIMQGLSVVQRGHKKSKLPCIHVCTEKPVIIKSCCNHYNYKVNNVLHMSP